MDVLDKLLEDGWIKTEDGFKKEIPNRNPLNYTPEEAGIKLIIHHWFNVPKFAVLFPDGGMLDLQIKSFKHLKQVEDAIDFYNPNF